VPIDFFSSLLSPFPVLSWIQLYRKIPYSNRKKLQQLVVLGCLMGKMKKKEKTMTRSKVSGWIMLVSVAFMFLSSGPALWSSETVPGFQEQAKTSDQQKKEQEKEKQAEKANGPRRIHVRNIGHSHTGRLHADHF
jgi:hypothetical protein